MGKRIAMLPLLLVVLAGLLGWRVHGQAARLRAPTGGSSTVEGTETVVASRIAGRLQEVSVREGDRVKAGQVVARLDCADAEAALAAAQARVSAAEAQRQAAQSAAQQADRSVGVARAQVASVRAQQELLAVDQDRNQRDLSRVSQLKAAGATTELELDNVTTRAKNLASQRGLIEANIATARASSAATEVAVHSARAQIAAAEANLVGANAELRRAQLAASECQLVAPRDGVITGRLQEPGAVLPAGARVLTVIDLATARLVFFVPDAELGRVKLGAPAEVHADAFPGRAFAGTVRRIASEAEFTPRDVQTREDRDRLVYAVEIEVANADGALRAGMPADVSLPGTGR